MFTEGFPGEEMNFRRVCQTERNIKALEIIFQYTYRQPQLNLSDVPSKMFCGCRGFREVFRLCCDGSVQYTYEVRTLADAKV